MSNYNLVLSTIQAFVAILLEHRSSNKPLAMIEPYKYNARLEYSRKNGKGGLNDFWRWLIHAMWQGVLITIIVVHSTDGSYEDAGDET